MSQTTSLFHLLRQRRQGQPGHYLSTSLDLQLAALEGRQSFTLSLIRERDVWEKPVTR